MQSASALIGLDWNGTALTKESVSGGDIFKRVAQAARFS